METANNKRLIDQNLSSMNVCKETIPSCHIAIFQCFLPSKAVRCKHKRFYLDDLCKERKGKT